MSTTNTVNSHSTKASPKTDPSTDYLENLPCGILIVGTNGEITYSNKISQSILDYDKKELLGLSIDKLVPKNPKTSHASLRQQYLKNPVARPMGQGNSLHAVQKSGKLVPVEVGLATVQSSGEAQVICCVNDISERQQLEERLQDYTEELKRSNEELDEFAYTVSHDLKEPLRGILTLVEFMREDLGDDVNGVSDYLNRIEEQGSRMGELIETVLEYSRLGRSSIQKKPLALKDLIDDIIEYTLASLPSAEGVEFQIEDTPHLIGDRVLVTELFSNLISNAIKYNDSTHKLVKIYFEKENNAYVVEDNGVGMTKDMQEKIFRMFFRAPSQKTKCSGTGVGMAIVKRIIQKHQGRIWIESEPGKGTRICVSFPTEGS